MTYTKKIRQDFISLGQSLQNYIRCYIIMSIIGFFGNLFLAGNFYLDVYYYIYFVEYETISASIRFFNENMILLIFTFTLSIINLVFYFNFLTQLSNVAFSTGAPDLMKAEKCFKGVILMEVLGGLCLILLVVVPIINKIPWNITNPYPSQVWTPTTIFGFTCFILLCGILPIILEITGLICFWNGLEWNTQWKTSSNRQELKGGISKMKWGIFLILIPLLGILLLLAGENQIGSALISEFSPKTEEKVDFLSTTSQSVLNMPYRAKEQIASRQKNPDQ